jgi:hypothetical protein
MQMPSGRELSRKFVSGSREGDPGGGSTGGKRKPAKKKPAAKKPAKKK